MGGAAIGSIAIGQYAPMVGGTLGDFGYGPFPASASRSFELGTGSARPSFRLGAGSARPSFRMGGGSSHVSRPGGA